MGFVSQKNTFVYLIIGQVTVGGEKVIARTGHSTTNIPSIFSALIMPTNILQTCACTFAHRRFRSQTLQFYKRGNDDG